MRNEEKYIFFNEEIVVHEQELRYFFWNRVKENERCTVDDLIQNTLMQAWNALDQIRNPRNSKKWLYAIARNELIRYYRDQSKRALVNDFKEYDFMDLIDWLVDPGDPIEEAIANQFEASDVKKALRQLEPEARELLWTYCFEDISVKEMAQKYGMKRSTFSSKISRILKKYKEIYMKMEKDK